MSLRIQISTCALVVLLLGAAPATADTLFDVEHARATARVGGPVSEHDAEFLERWGTHSGTPEWRHRTRETFEFYAGDDDAPRRLKRYRRSHRD